jgi:hypothetical protein
MYFIAGILILSGLGAIRTYVPVVSVSVSVLLGVESVIWIAYYLVLRSFIEGEYTAYHAAEYPLQLPIVIGVLCQAVATIAGVSVIDTLGALAGVGGVDLGSPYQTIVAIVRVLLLGTGVAALINSLPTIKPRANEMVAVVGSGDVVAKRILPALHSQGITRREVMVFTLTGGDTQIVDDGYALVQLGSVREVVNRIVSERAPAIIATSTDAHLPYIEAFVDRGVCFAVEKPVVGHTTGVRALPPAFLEARTGLALSYYTMEKGLPLMFALRPDQRLENYLESVDDRAITSEFWNSTRRSLGPLRSYQVVLREGRERSPSGTSRHWTETPPTLHPLIETSVHMLQFLFVADPQTVDSDFTDVNAAWGHDENRLLELEALGLSEAIAPTWLTLTGRCGDVHVDLDFKKFAARTECERTAKLEFENGFLVASFDECSVRLLSKTNEELALLTLNKPAVPYGILMDIFRRYAVGGEPLNQSDCRAAQFSAIEFWDALSTACGDIEVGGRSSLYIDVVSMGS